MKRERNIISIDEYGNITLPTDISTTTMTEWELCNLFGITAPTFRAGIKALCKSGVLREYGVRRTIRISDKRSIEVYSFETITALAFRIGTYGAERVRNALLDRIMHGRKEKTAVFVSLFTEGKLNNRWQA
ncbi:MAG: hypothetical protein EGP82_10075 [Odoribacter splanchnicus]|nr:hypothetical protein [Odoribacter splanchnicus]